MLGALLLLACTCSAAAEQVSLQLDSEVVDGDATLLWRGQQWRVIELSAAPPRRRLGTPPGQKDALGSLEFFFDLGVSVALVLAAGLMAGCTIGLMSTDPLFLQLKLLEGSEAERRWAAKVIRVTRHRHWMLVTLLLCNAAANEALPIFLDRLVSEELAIVISVTCVLFVGEVIPSALFSGPLQLRLGAALAPLVSLLQIITAPVSWPIAKALNKLVGSSHGMTRFRRSEFKALVRMQQRGAQLGQRRPQQHASSNPSSPPRASQPAQPSQPRQLPARNGTNTLREQLLSSSLTSSLEGGGETASEPVDGSAPLRACADVEEGGDCTSEPFASQPSFGSVSVGASELMRASFGSAAAAAEFHEDEVKILLAVLDLRDKVVGDLLYEGNRIPNMRMLSSSDTMDFLTMDRVIRWGFSRLPVYDGDRQNIVGVLLVKEQLMLDPEDATPVALLPLRRPYFVTPSSSALDLLHLFRTGRTHLVFVSERAKELRDCWAKGQPLPSDGSLLGLCTIEDVMEEIIGEEHADEAEAEHAYARTGSEPPRLHASTSAPLPRILTPIRGQNPGRAMINSPGGAVDAYAEG